ncbi:hypothetical protein KI655_18765 [Vibrio sp. D404a]|uniref:hypothetical protein n=1 Tax=unclassified Vibrio TaxID=2614977 RepID=UPI002556593F|nr:MULTISPECIES: hypothetical protein [unclassified Vibrio]MDK9739341.1 hypothetical protein [Vibrio sp. D404a]MDK9797624.1 hypothetical protein [Vibrio sp. D449a]
MKVTNITAQGKIGNTPVTFELYKSFGKYVLAKRFPEDGSKPMHAKNKVLADTIQEAVALLKTKEYLIRLKGCNEGDPKVCRYNLYTDESIKLVCKLEVASPSTENETVIEKAESLDMRIYKQKIVREKNGKTESSTNEYSETVSTFKKTESGVSLSR